VASGTGPVPGIRTIGLVSPEIAIATCDRLPEVDVDDRLLGAALTAAGLTPRLVAWNDPRVDWASFAATVVRSTWDYTTRRADFLAWADSVPRLFNPAEVIRANSDKRYLATLAARGVQVVPTEFVGPGEELVLPAEGDFVIKPTVGAGSRGAGRFAADEHGAAREHAARLHAEGRTAMVQPYLAEVDTAGETALIFLDGVYSHAIRKAALLEPGTRVPTDFGPLYRIEQIGPREPSAAERALADRALAAFGTDEPLLYARVDLLPGPDGPRVVELELAEPSLFLDHADGAADRLAAAIAARIGAGSSPSRPGRSG